MKNTKNLSLSERLEIKILLDKGYSQRTIAKVLKRGKSTVSYEIQHNSTNDIYDPHRAQGKARLRKRMRKLQFSKIEEEPELKRFVIEKLKARWNPDEIAGYLKRNQKEFPWYVSKTAIYEWLRTARGERYCKYLYSKRRYVKKHAKKTERVMIPDRVSIHERFLGATNRTRYGHWEADTVVGRKGTPGGVKTAIERKSRLFLAYRVESMRTREHAEALRTILSAFVIKSVTFDNGIENRGHKELGVPTFFADAYASGQRGSNEHGNKILRWSFPKKTDFSQVTQDEVDLAVRLINEKPRKILGYRSAIEVAERAGIIKSKSVLIQG